MVRDIKERMPHREFVGWVYRLSQLQQGDPTPQVAKKMTAEEAGRASVALWHKRTGVSKE